MTTTKPTTTKPRPKPPAAGKGRVAGVPNRTTRVLKEAILEAAEAVGENGKGKDGLVGYLKRVARKDVKAFSALLGKVLPMTVTGADGGAVQLQVTSIVRKVVDPK